MDSSKAKKAKKMAKDFMSDVAIEDQMDAVDNDLMRESDSSMPILKPERQSRVTFGAKGGSNN